MFLKGDSSAGRCEYLFSRVGLSCQQAKTVRPKNDTTCGYGTRSSQAQPNQAMFDLLRGHKSNCSPSSPAIVQNPQVGDAAEDKRRVWDPISTDSRQSRLPISLK